MSKRPAGDAEAAVVVSTVLLSVVTFSVALMTTCYHRHPAGGTVFKTVRWKELEADVKKDCVRKRVKGDQKLDLLEFHVEHNLIHGCRFRVKRKHLIAGFGGPG